MRHVAIVGAGPSGLFTAAALLKQCDVRIHAFERLPTPFGLVRYGVAPDHLKIKSVAKTLSRTLSDPRVDFYGNSPVGEDPTIADLRAAYDAVVVATGAPNARSLDIPGEALAGHYSAAEFVSWYNGHPRAEVSYAGGAEEVAIIGAGNVTIDVARILLKCGTGLTETDMPNNVLEALDRHPASKVHIIARRDSSRARFTIPELLELERLTEVDIVVHSAAAPDPEGADERDAGARAEIFWRWARRPPLGRMKQLHFHFLRSPAEILGTTRVEGVRLRINSIRPSGHLVATPVVEELPVGAVVRSIGYRGEAVPGLPFDAQRGVVPHERGRVEPGLYTVGWIKRGPTGVIGSNKACATETAGEILADFGRDTRDRSAVRAARRAELIARLSMRRGCRQIVTWNGWMNIDAAEIDLGARNGRPRTKITDFSEMIDISRRLVG